MKSLHHLFIYHRVFRVFSVIRGRREAMLIILSNGDVGWCISDSKWDELMEVEHFFFCWGEIVLWDFAGFAGVNLRLILLWNKFTFDRFFNVFSVENIAYLAYILCIINWFLNKWRMYRMVIYLFGKNCFIKFIKTRKKTFVIIV